MPHRRLTGLLAGGLLLVCAPAAAQAAPADVTVRVEGAGATLVKTVPVRTFAGTFSKTGDASQTCSGTSAGGALERATGGDWGGAYDGFGQRVERIRTESHTFDTGRYWALYVNDRPSDVGACDRELQQGDEVLFYAACAGAATGCFAGEPLDLRAPAIARPGEAFGVEVREVTTSYGGPPDYASSTTVGPSAGASVNGTATGADGRATLTLTGRGATELVATKGDRVREAVTVCVTDGQDGFCGTTTPDGRTLEPAPASVTAAAAPAAVPDRTAPRARIAGLREQQRFAKGKGPRELRGAVNELSLHSVKLRLTRTNGKRCHWFAGKKERFVGSRCGVRHGKWFAIGDRASWRYLLPGRLPKGRYVLDVKAVDKAFNRDEQRRRGENRVVFHVR
jgi:hypothetical protein